MIGLASASFQISRNSSYIDGNYFGGDTLTGRLNMSFTDQENSEFESNLEGGVSLLTLFERMNRTRGIHYVCDPVNCKDNYEFEGLGSQSTAHTLTREEKVYGFRVTGNVQEITSFSFNLSSDAGASCAEGGQLSIDLFDDGKIDFYNIKNGSGFCESPRAVCFDEIQASQTAILGSSFYCQVIYNLTGAPAYQIGIRLENEHTPGEIDLYLYNSSGRVLETGKRVTNAAPPVTSASIFSFQKGKFDAFVCARANSGTYRVKTETNNPKCGWSGVASVPSSFTSDYNLYARPYEYGAVGTIKFDDRIYQTLNQADLKVAIKNYIQETYGSQCPDDGCVIPLALRGNTESQAINIRDINIQYRNQNGIFETREIYNLRKSNFKISANYSLLDVSKIGFEIPNTAGNQTVRVYFDRETNSNQIIEKQINVRVGFAFDLGPRFALLGRETVFRAFSTENISSSVWNFGDGSSVVNSNNDLASHVYTTAGEYEIEVTLTSRLGAVSKKKFKILTGDAKTSANRTVADYQVRLRNLETQINSQPEWMREKIKEKTSYQQKKSSIERTISNYELLGQNAADSQYIQIINELLALNLPHSIQKTQEGKVSASLGFANIDASHIAKISGEESFDSNSLREAIVSWMTRYYDLEVEFNTLSGIGEETSEILTSYKISIIRPSEQESLPYLMIDVPKNSILFKSNYNAEETIDGGATYILLESSLPKEIEFAIVGEAPRVEDLGIYVSPVVSELEIEKPLGEVSRNEIVFSWLKFLIGIAILFFGVLIIYLFVQGWYKRNYEKHLFKNLDDLYNLINFIYNSRRAGLKDDEIRKKLKEKNWSGEQISYAFKKIDGKRTGMWEIPLFKSLENKKVKKELEKRQGRSLDARFIKRSSF